MNNATPEENDTPKEKEQWVTPHPRTFAEATGMMSLEDFDADMTMEDVRQRDENLSPEEIAQRRAQYLGQMDLPNPDNMPDS